MKSLVSIIVITYNSARYVLETLESAREQTYDNIELIISDDCSTDDTLEVCRKWIDENKIRFIRTEIINIDKNTGISANCNRGVKAAKGEWVKIIAGDDLLAIDCISLNISYIEQSTNDISIVLSDILIFKDGIQNLMDGIVHTPNNIDTLQENSDSKIQYLALLNGYFGNSPGLFVSRKVLFEIGFDERFHYVEDYPFALNATKMGYRFYYLNMVTVYYRITDNSVFASKSDFVLFNDFYLKRRSFDLEYIYPNIPRFERFIRNLEYRRKYIIDITGLNRNNFVCKAINYLSFWISPYNMFYNYFYEKKRNNIFIDLLSIILLIPLFLT